MSNDVDFLHLAAGKGFPPKIVLLKTGNQSNRFIEELLLRFKTEIKALSEAADYGVLEIF